MKGSSSRTRGQDERREPAPSRVLRATAPWRQGERETSSSCFIFPSRGVSWARRVPDTSHSGVWFRSVFCHHPLLPLPVLITSRRRVCVKCRHCDRTSESSETLPLSSSRSLQVLEVRNLGRKIETQLLWMSLTRHSHSCGHRNE